MNTNFLSVDLEDWYTAGHIRKYVTKDNYCECIQKSTEQILDVFSKKNVKATFFVLGEIGRKHPQLIKTIYNNGHEIASHGYSHTPIWNLNEREFTNEIKLTNDILSNIIGKKIIGFRAPNASLNKCTAWMLDVLENEGFLYDSSIFPMKTPIYGVKNAPLQIYKISSQNILTNNDKAKIIEIPFTIYKSSILTLPCTGGIYGRFLPIFVLRFLLNSVQKNRRINFYFHPYEIKNGKPNIKLPLYNTFVTSYHTTNYLKKIEKILKYYSFSSFENILREQKLI